MPNTATRYHKNIAALDENTSHHKLAARVPAGTSVLDIGCACGDMGIFLKETKQCRMTGIEYDEASLALAATSGAYDCLRQADLNNFDPLEHFSPASFDVLLFGDILEHLYDPQTVLKNFLPLLKEDGRVLISLPNVTHASIMTQLLLDKFEYAKDGVLDRSHIRFFSSQSMCQFLTKTYLEVETCDHVIYDYGGFRPDYLFQIPVFMIKYILALKYTAIFQYIIEARQSHLEHDILARKNAIKIKNISRENILRMNELKKNYTIFKIMFEKVKNFIKKYTKS